MIKHFKQFNFLVLPILILVLSFFWSAEVRANDILEITFEKEPLFEKTNFLPGDSIIGWIKVNNNNSLTHSIFLRTNNVVDPGNLGNALNLEIKEGANTLFNNSLSNLFATSSIYLSDLTEGHQTQYDLTITFDLLAGNEYQGKTLQFDLLVWGNSPEEENEDGDRDEGGGGGGTTLAVITGGGGGAPITLQIFNVKTTDITEDGATVTWQTTLFSTSQVIYSAEGESHTFTPSDPPYYGYSHLYPDPEDLTKVTFHTVLLLGLEPCTNYYYRVVSYQTFPTLPTISPEYSFTTLCLGIGGEEEEEEEKLPPITILPPTGEEIIPPVEAAPEEVEEEEIVEEKPEEKPTPFLASMLAAIGSAFKGSCFPWWLILIFVILPLIKGIVAFKRNKKEGIIWLISILIPITLAIWFFSIHYYCVAVWIFIALALATYLGWWLDKKNYKM